MVVPREDNLTIEKFKGLNCASHPTLIGDAQASSLQNVLFGKQGEIYRRKGLYLQTNFAYAPSWVAGKQMEILGTFGTGAQIGSPPSSVTWYIYTADGVPYSCYDNSGGGPLSSEVRAITGFPSDTVCVGCTQYKDILYFITSNHGIYKCPLPTTYTATSGVLTATAISGSPNGVSFCSFKDRLWVVQVGSATDPAGPQLPNWTTTTSLSSTIQYSAAFNFESWDPTDIQMVAPGNGDVITCLQPYSDRIIIFKKFSIWNAYTQGGDDPISALRLLTGARGAITTRSVVNVNEILFFLSHDGVWRTDGNAFSKLSEDVDPLFTYGPALTTYNQTDWITYYNDHLYIRTTSNQGANLPGTPQSYGGYYYLVYNVQNDSWAQEIYAGLTPSANVMGRPALCRTGTGNLQFLQGAIDRVYDRDSPLAYYIDDDDGEHFSGHTVTYQPTTMLMVTKRNEVDRHSRIKRMKYFVIGMSGNDTILDPYPPAGGLGIGATPQFTFIVDGVIRDPYDFDPLSVIRLGGYKVPGCGYFRTFELQIKDSTQYEFQITFLNFILHLKRQLAESPR